MFGALKECFELENTHRRKKKASSAIEKFKLFYCGVDKDPIHRPKEEFISLEKISSSYQFSVTGEGFVHFRFRSCYCLK